MFFIKVIFLVILSTFGNIFANTMGERSSHIIKLKPNSLIGNVSTLKKYGTITELNLSFGDYIELLSFNTEGLSKGIIQDIKNHPSVESVEPNFLCYPEENLDHGHDLPAVPKDLKDTKFLYQWYLRNNGHKTWVKNSPIGVDLNIIRAWRETKGNSNIIIATIDTGINHKHPDLRENLWINKLEKNGLAGVDDDGNGLIDDIHGYDFHNNDGDPMDGHGHGTHVAGIIGAVHNGIGVRGVMGKVSIMGLKFLSDKGPGDSKNAARAIEYAVNHGARIINNSWTSTGKSRLLFDALNYARKKGVLITASAGNVKKDNDKFERFPSNFELDNIIVVGALNAKDVKASFSNYGRKSVDIFAPGIKILSTDVKKSYYRRTGTSMSTPMVSGALGLLLTKYPKMNYQEAKRRLMETTVKKSNYLLYGRSGRVDVYRMLMNITTP